VRRVQGQLGSGRVVPAVRRGELPLRPQGVRLPPHGPPRHDVPQVPVAARPAVLLAEVRRSFCSELDHATTGCRLPPPMYIYIASQPFEHETCFSSAGSSLDVHRFDGVKLLNLWRGKKVMFVGDSLVVNQYESLLCMLHAAAPGARTNQSWASSSGENPSTTVRFEVRTFFVPSLLPPLFNHCSVCAMI
jgi:hypothetical protein